MTTRQHTKLVLNEFIGTALAIGAGIGAAAYGTKKLLDSGGTSGLRFRTKERAKIIVKTLANKSRESLLAKSDTGHTEAHDQIATAYGMKSREYAAANHIQIQKAKAIQASDILKAQNLNPSKFDARDSDHIINKTPGFTPRRINPNNARNSIHAISNTITEFELRDTTNSTARNLRIRMNKDVFAPQAAARKRITDNIAQTPLDIAKMKSGIVADRAKQKTDLETKRKSLPDPNASGIDRVEKTKRLLRVGFQGILDRARTIV